MFSVSWIYPEPWMEAEKHQDYICRIKDPYKNEPVFVRSTGRSKDPNVGDWICWDFSMLEFSIGNSPSPPFKSISSSLAHVFCNKTRRNLNLVDQW